MSIQHGDFRSWVQCESAIPGGIVIQGPGGEDLSLVSCPENAYSKQFSYQTDDGYSQYYVVPRKAEGKFYGRSAVHATHLVVTKSDPINPGVDNAFLARLVEEIRKSGYPLVPWKEGANAWTDVLKAAMPDADASTPKGEFQDIPDVRKAVSHVSPVVGMPSVSVSKASGGWTVVMPCDSYAINGRISTVIRMMEGAAKPLVEKGFIDFYEVYDLGKNKRIKMVEAEGWKTKMGEANGLWERGIGYFKHIAPKLLPPALAAYMTSRFKRSYPDYDKVSPQPNAAREDVNELVVKNPEFSTFRQYESVAQLVLENMFRSDRKAERVIEVLNQAVPLLQGDNSLNEAIVTLLTPASRDILEEEMSGGPHFITALVGYPMSYILASIAKLKQIGLTREVDRVMSLAEGSLQRMTEDLTKKDIHNVGLYSNELAKVGAFVPLPSAIMKIVAANRKPKPR